MVKRILIVITIVLCLFLANTLYHNLKHYNEFSKMYISYIKPNYVDDDFILIENNPLLKHYKEFLKTIKLAKVSIPLDGDMVPQGIITIDDYYLVTSYNSKRDGNSKINILDKEGKIIKEIFLQTNSHVGGLAYDEVNDYLWIPDNDGVLNVYKYQDIFTSEDLKPLKQFTDIGEDLTHYLDKKKREIAYLSILDNNLYVGSFSNNGKGKIKKYQIINENDDIKLKLQKEYWSPILIQGMTFYNYNNKQYLLLSSSIGQNNTSHLQVIEFDDKLNDITKMKRTMISFPPMLEQIVVKDNSLIALFESGAKKYDKALIKIDKICLFDLLEIMQYIN